MIRTVYIHVGFHKTGSTSIQNSLFRSADLLRSNNYLFPIMTRCNQPISNHEVVFCSLALNNPELYYGNIVAGFSDKETITDLNNQYILQFKQQISSFNGENLIISGEGISIMQKDELRRLQQLLYQTIHPGVSIKIIAFLRNPLSYSCSLCQERIKNGNALITDLVLYEQSKYRYYTENILRIEDVFGRENIKLIRFEDAIEHQSGLLGCFLSTIGFDKSLISGFKSIHENMSLSYEAVVLLSAINEKKPLIVDGKLNQERSSDMLNEIRNIPGVKFQLTNEQNRTVWQNATNDLEWLYENYDIEPYQYFEENDLNDQKRWSEVTLLYIKDLLPRLSEELRQIICQKVIDETGVDVTSFTPVQTWKSKIRNLLKRSS